MMPLFGLVVLGVGLLELGITLVAAIAMLISWGTRVWLPAAVCGIPVLLFGVAVMGLGLVLAVGHRDHLWEEQSGRFYHQISIAEHVIYESVTDSPEVISFALPDASGLTHPASVTAILLHPPARSPRSLIYWNRYAVELLLTSVVSLLVCKMLMVERADVHRSFFGRTFYRKPTIDYFFLPSRRDDDARAVGALERRIMQVIVEWPAHSAASPWPHAMPSHRLAIALIGQMRWNPGRWLYGLVRQDLQERFAIQWTDGESGIANSTLHAEGAALEEWLQKVSVADPDFVAALRSHLFRGLAYMEWDYPEVR